MKEDEKEEDVGSDEEEREAGMGREGRKKMGKKRMMIMRRKKR